LGENAPKTQPKTRSDKKKMERTVQPMRKTLFVLLQWEGDARGVGRSKGRKKTRIKNSGGAIVKYRKKRES